MDYPFKREPEPGKKFTVCEGVDWIRMPLPFALDHVNCWLLGEPGLQVLIDTGVNDQSTQEHWHTLFNDIGQWPKDLLVTHFHPDHMGLAGWIGEKISGELLGSAIEINTARTLHGIESEAYEHTYQQWYSSNGLPQSTCDTVRSNGNTYKGKVFPPPVQSKWRFLADGQCVELAGRSYRVIVGRGHSPDMIMLYREDDHVLIAADQVLPRITPNVSVMPRLSDNNPLQSFLHTLTKLEALPDDTLVLPSHGQPFKGLKPRLAFLKTHHELRLDEIWQACKSPCSAHDLFPVLFSRKLDAQQTSFALGETLAHLHYLEQQGRVQRLEQASITRFKSIAT